MRDVRVNQDISTGYHNQPKSRKALQEVEITKRPAWCAVG